MQIMQSSHEPLHIEAPVIGRCPPDVDCLVTSGFISLLLMHALQQWSGLELDTGLAVTDETVKRWDISGLGGGDHLRWRQFVAGGCCVW